MYYFFEKICISCSIIFSNFFHNSLHSKIFVWQKEDCKYRKNIKDELIFAVHIWMLKLWRSITFGVSDGCVRSSSYFKCISSKFQLELMPGGWIVGWTDGWMDMFAFDLLQQEEEEMIKTAMVMTVWNDGIRTLVAQCYAYQLCR